MSNPFVFDGATLSDYTAWLAGGVDTDNVARSFAVGETGALQVTGMTTTESLTTSGGLITPATRELNVDGDGLPVDSGYGIWPAATNLVTNGGFETNTTGWISPGSNTIQRVNCDTEGIPRMFGEHCLKITVQDNATFASFAITLTATAHAAGVWLYIPASFETAGGVFTGFTGFAGSSGTQGVTANMGLRDQWQRAAGGTCTPIGSDLSGFFLVSQSASLPTPGSVLYIDGAQIELGSIATPYIETDGSTESRTAGRIQMPVADLFTATQGAVFARVRQGWNSVSTTVAPIPNVFGWRNGQDRLELRYFNGTQQALRWDDITDPSVTIADTFVIGDRDSLAFAWDAAEIHLSLDGAAFVSTSNTVVPTTLPANADWGGNGIGSSGAALLGNILWTATFAGTLTDADAAALNALGDTPPTWAQLVSSVAICAMPTALWRAEDGTFIKASYAPDGGS